MFNVVNWHHTMSSSWQKIECVSFLFVGFPQKQTLGQRLRYKLSLRQSQEAQVRGWWNWGREWVLMSEWCFGNWDSIPCGDLQVSWKMLLSPGSWRSWSICLPTTIKFPWVCQISAFLGCPVLLELKKSVRQRTKNRYRPLSWETIRVLRECPPKPHVT